MRPESALQLSFDIATSLRQISLPPGRVMQRDGDAVASCTCESDEQRRTSQLPEPGSATVRPASHTSRSLTVDRHPQDRSLPLVRDDRCVRLTVLIVV